MRIIGCIFSLLAIFTIGCGDDSGSSSSASSSGEVASNSGGASGSTGGNTGNAPSAGGGMSGMMGGDMGDGGGMGMGGPGMGGDMSGMMGGDMGDGGGMGMGGPGMGGDMSEMMGGTMGEGGEGMGMGGPGMGGDMSEMMGGTMGEGGEGMGMGGPGMGGMDDMSGMGEGMGMGGPGMGGMDDMSGMGEGMGMGGPGMGGMGDMSGMGGGQPTPKTLAEMANNSYAQGKDKQAIDLIYAAAIADENSDNILTHFRWIPGAKRPGLAVRFGIAINVKMTPRDYNGDAKPIGTEQQLTSNRGGNNGNQGFGDGSGGPPGLDGMEGMGDMSGMGGMGMMGGQSGGGIPEELKKYTGDLGEEIAKALKERVTKGYFGTILQVAASKSSPSGGGDSMGMGGMGDMAGMGGMEGPGMGGMGGPGMGGMGGPGMGGMGGGGSNGIAPGIVMLGEGTIDQILETAVEEDLDAIIFFDTSVVHIPKNGLVRNTTNMSLYDVSSGRQLKKSVPLVNIALQTERKRAKDQKKPDPLVEKVNDFLQTVDMNYKMAKMPQNLTAAVVQQHRLIPLVNSKTISPLKALAEIAFYHKYGLCPEAHRKIAYDSIVGQQMSAQLIAGSLELRLSAVDVFLDVESSKILLKPSQAENDGGGGPFGNEGALPGANSGSNPMGPPGAAAGVFPGAM